MKVIQVPDYALSLYQDALVDSLCRIDIEVCRSNAWGLFGLSRLVWRNMNADIIHIQWIDALVPKSRYKLVTLFKKLCFALDIFIVKKLLRKTIIWTIHNKLSHECRDVAAELFARRLLARNCDWIIIFCNGAKKSLGEYYGFDERKTSVIPHGHCIDNYKNTVTMADARSRLGIPGDAFVYCCVGLVREYKRVPELLDVFRRLNDAGAYLLVAGKPCSVELEQRIREAARGIANLRLVMEFIEPDDMQYFINAADIIVLPYEKILNSGVVVQAMSFAKPVIAPQMGCLPEALAPGGAVFFQPGVEENLLNAMREARRRTDLAEMGRLNFEKIKKIDWLFVAQETARAYQSAVAASSGRRA